MTTDIDVTDLCDQRAETATGDILGCLENLGHDDGGWHYDLLAGAWWRRTVTGPQVITDPGHRPRTAAGQRKETSMQLTPTPAPMTRQQVREMFAGRNRAVVDAAQWFTWGHLPEGLPQDAAAGVANIAEWAIRTLPDTPELTHALRRLLEAKDCLVRAAVDASEPQIVSGDGQTN